MTKHAGVILLGLSLLLGSSRLVAFSSQDLTLATEGQASFPIFISPGAPPPTVHAASELKIYLDRITRASFAIEVSSSLPEEGGIVVGNHPGMSQLGVDFSSLNLGQEGYFLSAKERYLLIGGGEPRGTLYGVYAFLEENLHVRWFTPDLESVTTQTTLRIPFFQRSYVPPLIYREVLLSDCQDPDWCARHKLNGHHIPLDEERGGKISYNGFVHTWEGLLPPEEFFNDHPEYYSQVAGVRRKERSQLCCSNPEVARLVAEAVLDRIQKTPDRRVFSVSQNDWFNFCECEACTRIAEAEGSQAGPVLHLVNQVAREVAQQHPDKWISTLAYQYSRTPPLHIRPEANVIVRLCSIECSFAQPLEEGTCPENQTFAEDLIGWSKIADRLWVWNYNTSFDHFLIPYPNLWVRDANTRFFVRNRVTGLFEQDVSGTIHGELSPLSGYLTAQLLWDPSRDGKSIVREFVEGVYAEAAGPVLEYIHLLQSLADDKTLFLGIREGPESAYLTEKFLEKADLLWQEAEVAVAAKPDVLARVRADRLSVDYALLEKARLAGWDHLYGRDVWRGRTESKPDFRERVLRFIQVAEESGLTNIAESKGDFTLHKATLLSFLEAPETPPNPCTLPATTPEAGIRFALHLGSWHNLPDFGALEPIRTGIASALSIESVEERELFGLHFTGYLKVPETAVYVFSLSSNDGSRLAIDGKTLIDHDGLHRQYERLGALHLEEGFHPIEVSYFESSGKEGLAVTIEGPGFLKQQIPERMLFH